MSLAVQILFNLRELLTYVEHSIWYTQPHLGGQCPAYMEAVSAGQFIRITLPIHKYTFLLAVYFFSVVLLIVCLFVDHVSHKPLSETTLYHSEIMLYSNVCV